MVRNPQRASAVRPQFPKCAHSDPILRWVGGKRWLIPLASDLVYEYLHQTGGRYFEPFAGGAALALDLGLPGMVVSDLCEPLINLYQQSQTRPDAVYRAVEQFKARGTDKETYYYVRDQQARPSDPLERAAWLFYVNALCFNGVFRENSKGKFNVPYGARATGNYSFISLERLRIFAKAVRDVEFACSDFTSVIMRASAGDLVFADSPYFGVFDKYLKEGFSMDQHIALARALQAAAERGVAFLTTNNDVPEIRRLYRWAHVTTTGEYRRVNRNAKDRGKVNCLLIASSKALLQPAS